jgi:two-component sensor histidine kinase
MGYTEGRKSQFLGMYEILSGETQRRVEGISLFALAFCFAICILTFFVTIILGLKLGWDLLIFIFIACICMSAYLLITGKQTSIGYAAFLYGVLLLIAIDPFIAIKNHPELLSWMLVNDCMSFIGLTLFAVLFLGGHHALATGIIGGLSFTGAIILSGDFQALESLPFMLGLYIIIQGLLFSTHWMIKHYLQEIKIESDSRKAAIEDLKATVTQKEQLISKVQHRVFNNLQNLKSLIAMKTRDADLVGARLSVADLQRCIGSLSIAYEANHGYEDKDVVDFAMLVDMAMHYAFEAWERPWFNHSFEGLEQGAFFIGMDPAVNFTMVLSESIGLLASAMKPDGSIAVTAERDGDALVLKAKAMGEIGEGFIEGLLPSFRKLAGQSASFERDGFSLRVGAEGLE